MVTDLLLSKPINQSGYSLVLLLFGHMAPLPTATDLLAGDGIVDAAIDRAGRAVRMGRSWCQRCCQH
jgi:hypothetical protein